MTLGLDDKWAGSLLFPPQITVLGFFFGAASRVPPSLPSACSSIYLPIYPQIPILSAHLYQLIPIKTSLDQLFSVNWSLSNLPWPNIHLWTDQPLSNLSLSNLPLSALSLALCVAGWRLVRAWTPQSPLRFAWQVRRLVTFSCVVSNWCLSNLPLSSFLRQNYPTYLYQTYFCQTFSPSLSLSLSLSLCLSLKLIFNLSDLPVSSLSLSNFRLLNLPLQKSSNLSLSDLLLSNLLSLSLSLSVSKNLSLIYRTYLYQVYLCPTFGY